MYLNLGDLGINIKSYVDEYQLKHKSSMNIESIEDMKKFMEDYPEFRKLSGNVTKHVTLVGELSRIVEKESLLEVSELEQSLACSDNHTMDLKVRGMSYQFVFCLLDWYTALRALTPFFHSLDIEAVD